MDFVECIIPSIQRIATPNGRRYQTPDGKLYPSVTTITGLIGELTGDGVDYIKEWRDKVGHDTADKISRQAADRGTLIHENVEYWCKGLPEKFDMFQQEEQSMFRNMIPVLKTIDQVYCMETGLWSDKIAVAGTVDMIAMHNGRLKIIDWKTSRRYKNKAEIRGYFAQCAAYAYMFWERTGLMVNDILIVMTTQDDGILLFEEKVKDHLDLFLSARKLYKEKFNE